MADRWLQKCGIEMSDKFAAIVQAEGSFSSGYNLYTFKHTTKLHFNTATKIMVQSATGTPVALSKLATILSTPANNILYRSASTHVKS